MLRAIYVSLLDKNTNEIHMSPLTQNNIIRFSSRSNSVRYFIETVVLFLYYITLRS